MHFLPDVYVQCEVCHGKRYNRETLSVTYRGKNIADVLQMTAEEALQFFEHHPKISRKLKTLVDVGLGYIQLGQPASTLSGGEAQRAGIARALINNPKIVFADEPTGALNSANGKAVLDALTEVNGQGQSVAMVTHDLRSALRGSRILYLRDGVIKGECLLSKYTSDDNERHNKLNDFLKEMEW
jgi:excinuclease ABC subunit A